MAGNVGVESLPHAQLAYHVGHPEGPHPGVLDLLALSLPHNDTVHPARAMNVSISKAPDRGLGCNGWLFGFKRFGIELDRSQYPQEQ